jgi:hypothetical protein
VEHCARGGEQRADLPHAVDETCFAAHAEETPEVLPASSIVADDRTATHALSVPDHSERARQAVPIFCAISAGTGRLRYVLESRSVRLGRLRQRKPLVAERHLPFSRHADRVEP